MNKKQNRSATILTAMIAWSVGVLGCRQASSRPREPPVAQDGVEVALVSVRCDQVREIDTEQIIEVAVKLAVTNSRETPAQFFPERVRLLEPRPLSPLRSEGGGTIEKGQRRIVHVQFEDRRGASCGDRMRLDAADSLVWSDRTAHLEPLAFVPTP